MGENMKNKKVVISIVFSVALVLVLLFSIILPTFSRFRSGIDDPEWDGLMASEFKRGTGTEADPFIISTPNEFAYFSNSLNNEDYMGKYVKLTKDIVINKGVFKNNTYIYNDVVYYMGDNNKYYEEDTLETEAGNIQVFPIIDGFKGHFDGDFHTIYGLYEKDNNKNALFTNFSGELKNLYIDNAYISGGYITAGVVSDAKNATIKNVLFDGRVTGNNNTRQVTKTVQINDFNVADTTTKTINIPMISNISQNTLTGTCSGTDTFTLNNIEYNCTNFEIETSNVIEIIVTNEASFENVEYTLTYTENKTSGIVGLAENSNLEGLVNKGNVSGMYTTGIVGTVLNSNIKNSYNMGTISGERSSGIADIIMYSNNSLENVYNNGNLQANTKYGLVSNIYNSTVSVKKAFNTKNVYMLNNTNSTISVENSYNVENYTTNDFILLNYQSISPLYPKYTSNQNISNGNIWVGEEIPILYFDDIKNRTVQIKIGNTIWDTYNENINDVRYNNEVELLITTTDMYKPIKNVWYYASNEVIDEEDLDEVSWTEYNGIFRLNNNVYIVYVKYEDYNDNVYYINTDKLIIGTVSLNVSIRSGSTSWSAYHNPVNKYLNRPTTYEIINNGASLSVSRIDYLISNTTMTNQELEEAQWTRYTTTLTPQNDIYIIYAKITNIDSSVTYINTDKMINMSYQISNLKSGNNQTFSNNMTYNSSFNFNVSLTHRVNLPSFDRYIKVDKQLPNNTLITIKDNNGVYYESKLTTHNYDSNLNAYLYPLSGFKKVGKATFDEYFDDDDYNSNSESFDVFIDFKNISATANNYTISFIAKQNEVVNTAYNQEITFNLVNVDTNTLSVTSSYNNTIDYGREATYTIPITTSLPATTQNGNTITNTTYENMYEGLLVEVYDTQNNVVSRNVFKNLRLKYNNTIYVFDNNNRANINLGNNHNQNVNLQVLTYNDNTNINGTYNIKIKGYLSVDGINKKYQSSNTVTIPLRFTSSTELDYSFDVSLTQPIINKGGSFSFNVDYDGDLVDPILKVSLLRKKRLTAYNQEYELVDLKDYVSNRLTSSNSSIYEIDVDDIVFNIKNNVQSNGYKFVFELYDGNDKVNEAAIKTIIR